MTTTLRRAGVALLAAGLLLSGCGTTSHDRPSAPDRSAPDRSAAEPGRRPFPQHVDLPAGALTPSHVGQAEQDEVVREHYDAWKERYLRTEGGDGAWIKYDDTMSTVSEAHGYGMVLAAYFDDRSTFDSMLDYYLRHPSKHGRHLMAWKQTLRGGRMVDVQGRFSATDGDLDIAYALLLADRQWGSQGRDYLGSARAVLADILAWDVHPRLMSLNVGDWTHGTRRARYTRSSDFMLGHLLTFARRDPANAARWRQVYRQTRQVVRDQFHHGSERTGLVPDFLVHRGGRWRPVPGRWLETRHDGDFYWNAARTPWRISMSWLSHGRTDLIAPQRTMARWLRKRTDGNPRRIRDGYFVRNGPNGRPIDGNTDLAFTAPMAVNAMAGGPGGQRWVNRLWDEITSPHYPPTTGYYGDAIRLQVLLTVSGNWWAP